MSRIGNKAIDIPSGVEVNVAGDKVTVKGSKGTLEQELKYGVTAKVEDNKVVIESDGEKVNRKFHGLYRALINNCVVGVSTGFSNVVAVCCQPDSQCAPPITWLDSFEYYTAAVGVFDGH